MPKGVYDRSKAKPRRTRSRRAKSMSDTDNSGEKTAAKP